MFVKCSVSIITCFGQIGGGEIPDETTLICRRGSDRFENLYFLLSFFKCYSKVPFHIVGYSLDFNMFICVEKNLAELPYS